MKYTQDMDLKNKINFWEYSSIYDCIEKGADVNYSDEDGYTPLILCSIYGLDDIIKIVISAGADINLIGKDGMNALMWACSRGHKSTVEILISSGADINIRSLLGLTALNFAIMNCDEEICQILECSGADVNSKDKNGLTLLALFSLMDKKDCVTFMVNQFKNIDLNSRNGTSEATALMACSYEHNYKIVKLLIDAGADVNCRDKFGNTALQYSFRKWWSVSLNKFKTIYILIKNRGIL